MTTAISNSRSVSDELVLRNVPRPSMRSASFGLCSQIKNGLGKKPRPRCTASSTANCSGVSLSGAISEMREPPWVMGFPSSREQRRVEME